MADITTGATVVFGTSAFSAELMSVGLPGVTRQSIDTTHMGTTVARTFIPSDLIDWGELEIEFAFDPDNEPPMDGVAETITITFPIPSGGIGGATIAGSGFFTNFSMTGPLEEKMTATATIKWSGDLTWTDST